MNPAAALKALPKGTVEISAGLGILGVCAYLFLLVAGRVLGDAAYAPLGALWILVFLIGPAFLYPVEQELSRAIAARTARNDGVRPVFRRAAVLTTCLVGLMVVICAATYPVLDSRIFDGSTMLFFGLVSSIVSYAIAYMARGLFAGRGELRAYGLLISLEGILRLGAGVVLALVGIEDAGPYGLAVGLGPLAAVLVTVAVMKMRPVADGSEARWGELTSSMGNLIAGSMLSQLLVNVSALIVKFFASAAEQAQAGAFAKAVVITRIPLFLFQAIQAISLPRLARAVALGDRKSFDTTYWALFAGVAVIGLAGTLAALVLGEQLLVLFGSDTGLERGDITLLAFGNAVFLVAMAVAQGLIAIHRQGMTVWGWLAGVVAMALVVVQQGDLLFRVEVSLLVGALVATVVMQVALGRLAGPAFERNSTDAEAELRQTGTESTSLGGETTI